MIVLYLVILLLKNTQITANTVNISQKESSKLNKKAYDPKNNKKENIRDPANNLK